MNKIFALGMSIAVSLFGAVDARMMDTLASLAPVGAVVGGLGVAASAGLRHYCGKGVEQLEEAIAAEKGDPEAFVVKERLALLRLALRGCQDRHRLMTKLLAVSGVVAGGSAISLWRQWRDHRASELADMQVRMAKSTEAERHRAAQPRREEAPPVPPRQEATIVNPAIKDCMGEIERFSAFVRDAKAQRKEVSNLVVVVLSLQQRIDMLEKDFPGSPEIGRLRMALERVPGTQTFTQAHKKGREIAERAKKIGDDQLRRMGEELRKKNEARQKEIGSRVGSTHARGVTSDDEVDAS